jgi:hypothetical protein
MYGPAIMLANYPGIDPLRKSARVNAFVVQCTVHTRTFFTRTGLSQGVYWGVVTAINIRLTARNTWFLFRKLFQKQKVRLVGIPQGSNIHWLFKNLSLTPIHILTAKITIRKATLQYTCMLTLHWKRFSIATVTKTVCQVITQLSSQHCTIGSFDQCLTEDSVYWQILLSNLDSR